MVLVNQVHQVFLEILGCRVFQLLGTLEDLVVRAFLVILPSLALVAQEVPAVRVVLAALVGLEVPGILVVPLLGLLQQDEEAVDP